MTAEDFWFTSGWHLMDRDSDGWMVPSEAFMAAYFNRPELEIVEESCAAEIALNAKLQEAPFSVIDDAEIDAIADNDVADNYRAVLRFRDFLSQYSSLEAAYLAAARGAEITFPPLFMEHMVHIILRNILDGETDPMKLRAAEILFRDQRVTIDDGRIMVADRTTVDLSAEYRNLTGEDADQANRDVQIDILSSETAPAYWQRHDLFNMSVDIAFTQPALDALCRVLEEWLRHFLGVTVRISPKMKIEDENWRWHLGLDSEATSILNDLYDGSDVAEDRLQRILCLFELIADEAVETDYRGKPIYLGLAMNAAGLVRAKPQNLLANLPLQSPQS